MRLVMAHRNRYMLENILSETIHTISMYVVCADTRIKRRWKTVAVIDDIKSKICNEVISETELENLMAEFGFSPLNIDEETENLLKYTNFKCQIWIDVVRDEENNLLCENIRQVTKEKGEETKVEPIHTFEELLAIEDYFKDNGQNQYWLIGWLISSLGRRVGDIVALKWSDLYKINGNFRDRLSTLKEEKTGKTIGLSFSNFARARVEEYCEMENINPMEHYNEKVFSVGSAAFRKNLKKAIDYVGIDYPVSTHSLRKFFGTMLSKLHPNDGNAIKIIQYIFGHSSEEITKVYIGTIDEKKDKFVSDLSDYLENSYVGKAYEIDNSPVITLKTADLRELIQEIYTEGMSVSGQNGIEVASAIGKFISIAESKMVG